MPHAALDNFYEEVIPDASADQAALEQHIDQELGLPTNEETKDANADGETTEAEATTDTDGATEDGEPDETTEEADSQPDDSADQTADQPAVDGPSISVTDINGKEYKITKIEDLPEDFTPKNNRQVIEILNNLQRLETETVRAAADAQAKQQEAEAQAQQQAQLKSWDSEIDQLQREGRLDKPKAAPGSDGFMDDTAVKKVDAVFKFMADTNSARQTAGNPNLIRSFEDALDKYELAESKKAAVEADKAETQAAKKNSSLIGGSSSGGGEGAPVYRAGQANSIWDL